jgi:hypothetical protein
LHIPPSDLAGFFARRIGGQHEEPWLDIVLGGSEAVCLNPEQRKAVEMTGINPLHVEIERLAPELLRDMNAPIATWGDVQDFVSVIECAAARRC